jgi:hypothetical protein
MRPNDIVQVVIYIGLLTALTVPLGKYMFNIFTEKRTFMHPVLGWLERLIYKASGINPDKEMNWKSYTISMLVFNLAGFLLVWLLQALQQYLPLNPQGLLNVPPDMLFASASGVDPHISPEAARFQVDRIALARHFSPEQKHELNQLVERSIEQPQLGFLGDRIVNVLKLNLELDKLK